MWKPWNLETRFAFGRLDRISSWISHFTQSPNFITPSIKRCLSAERRSNDLCVLLKVREAWGHVFGFQARKSHVARDWDSGPERLAFEFQLCFLLALWSLPSYLTSLTLLVGDNNRIYLRRSLLDWRPTLSKAFDIMLGTESWAVVLWETNCWGSKIHECVVLKRTWRRWEVPPGGCR